ncbi:MAG: RluA family pseudouridine synthase [Endozoicomonadaceae bacterium]|nr:RluA family pseudouridine synthase [Endozoicomonadaceae bacterium]
MTKNIVFEKKITDEHQGLRVDLVAKKLLTQYSRSLIQRWIKAEALTVNGLPVKSKNKVIIGDHFMLNVHHQADTELQPEALSIPIIFEDEHILIINKPTGLVVHPAAGNTSGTLVNGLLAHHSDLINLPRAGLVHRLDKNTSGLLVVAKTLIAHQKLILQMKERTIKRQYTAIICGTLLNNGTINAPIGRHPYHRTKMAVTTNGKQAITHYVVKENFKHYTLLTVYLETGRTHQIRVHFQHQGFPLLGDPTYGGMHAKKNLHSNESDIATATISQFTRQALHAESLSIEHPINGKKMTWNTSLPDDLSTLIHFLQDNQSMKTACFI